MILILLLILSYTLFQTMTSNQILPKLKISYDSSIWYQKWCIFIQKRKSWIFNYLLKFCTNPSYCKIRFLYLKKGCRLNIKNKWSVCVLWAVTIFVLKIILYKYFLIFYTKINYIISIQVQKGLFNNSERIQFWHLFH